ncbi:FkbM family methyltransferase [Leptolyngbya sp. FACHB-16]|uniref:FkbM family methyltransferase n=1 Tax=unclassified Leptolyngbya TaxID=2650499 RepID=UPI001683A7A7|nr:FkbM family methyltransferase [Leptolyngbya sp. FACHB-16]MBD2156181.1 FkbM family methyltransferase [Leptolyngbya sp. FACHB-16]
MIPRFLRDSFFKLWYGFRGVPRTLGKHSVRFDESLRRWELEAEDVAIQAIQQYLHPGQVFVDVGANFGLHTLHAAKQVGEQGFVFAFEPVPSNLKLLRRNIALNGIEHQVLIVPSAVSNQTEATLSFHVPDEEIPVTASLSTAEQSRSIQVANVRLDDYWEMVNRPIHLIKIDVEGAELEVLRGAENLLQRWRPHLLIEVHGFALPAFGSSVEELQDFLTKLGYQEHRLESAHFSGKDYYQAIYLCQSASELEFQSTQSEILL